MHPPRSSPAPDCPGRRAALRVWPRRALGDGGRVAPWAALLGAWALAAGGCGGPRRAPSALEAGGGAGARLQGLLLWEERDLVPSLELRAREADFDPGAKVVVLRDLELRFELPEQRLRGGVLTAAAGRLEAPARRLSLEGGVRLRDGEGRTLQSGQATYHLEPRRLEVPGATTAQAGQGRATAGRATADLRAEAVVLEGGVDAELLP